MQTNSSRKESQIALFTMEVGIDAKLHTYSGGLGVLAGDILRSCADMSIPILAVTLASNEGYLYQKLDDSGNQIEEPESWRIDDYTELMSPKVTVFIEGREVKIQAWRYTVSGLNGFQVPVYFLDTNLFENDPCDRKITFCLYGGDKKYRLKQEIVLGIGGVRMLDALGHNISRYHMNEGHSALVAMELMKKAKEANQDITEEEALDMVRDRCIFTTHTPVSAGHDVFPVPMVKQLLGDYLDEQIERISSGNELDMTLLALSHSEYINGVAKRHGEVFRTLYPGYPVDSITNGVHHVFWTSHPFRKLYDSYISGWRKDPFDLRYVASIPRTEILNAHDEAKRNLIDFVNSRNDIDMDYNTLTLGFARRITKYKRPDLLFSDPHRLVRISRKYPLQIILAGKAHPKDVEGKELLKYIFEVKEEVKRDVKLVFLENYNMELAKMLIPGVDLWLNTPKRPLEASGTSGMKASLNGVPQLSILDGWWLEGCIEGITGWGIGAITLEDREEAESAKDAQDLYNKLENLILPMFYRNMSEWTKIMRYTIAFNSSFFNSHRMVQQYLLNAYF
ncbi:MAG: alpha-glucan family phosphorylase [Candidatus Hadarchaeota archaeon]